VTIKVALRRWRSDDAQWYAEQSQDSEILRWTTERKGLTSGEVLEAIEGIEEDNSLAWVAIDAETGRRLANAAVEVSGGVAEVSYWVAAYGRGHGVATQLLKLLVIEALAAGHQRIEAVIAEGNTASRRVVEKVGLVPISFQNQRGLGQCVRYGLPLEIVQRLTNVMQQHGFLYQQRAAGF
jgi:RimJ/RimL family protein N-acetyltransferase